MELAQVKSDTSVLKYFNNTGAERAAISSLCYRIFGTHEPEVRKLHQQSILQPYKRRRSAKDFANKYLSNLRFGDSQLEIDLEPLDIPTKSFSIPDLEFGNSRFLSVKGTAGTTHTSLEELGEARLRLLKDTRAGFFGNDPLGRQYWIVPESVNQSWGNALLTMLKTEVANFLVDESGYDPIVVPYNDLVARTYAEQSRSILRSAEQFCKLPGHAVVMIHHVSKYRPQQEDTLAAMVIQELRNRLQIPASVIHSRTGEESFELGKNTNGQPEYVIANGRRGKLLGYAQQVALNKILLLNERCPFILSNKLHADFVVGIDVKANTAGFILIDGFGKNYRYHSKTSREKEKLRSDQIQTYCYQIIKDEISSQQVAHQKNIVIHRDGQMWPSEIAGVKRAFERLKRENLIAWDSTLTLVEIAKSEMAPFRMFEIYQQNGFTRVENPQIGQYEVRADEGYICTTGRAFKRPGTSLPLHVRKIEGALTIEECLEDVFFLSNLTWTKPNDCSREAITIRLNDRFLKDEATAYDQELLETLDSESEAYGSKEVAQ
ncbi:MAG: hypothetical protein E6H09_21915 [Bacteroidetes bacterium]|nr:MAG: hypothetical protein E6H09_21915 [Bacteroidota bacterium]